MNKGDTGIDSAPLGLDYTWPEVLYWAEHNKARSIFCDVMGYILVTKSADDFLEAESGMDDADKGKFTIRHGSMETVEAVARYAGCKEIALGEWSEKDEGFRILDRRFIA